MNYVIIGAGSIGCLFGAYLSRISTNKVYLYTSKKKNRKIFCTQSLKLRNFSNKLQKISNFNKAPPVDEFFKFFKKRLPILIIATKAYNNIDVCKEYKDILKKYDSIFLLQNGLGNEEIYKKEIPNLKIFRIITTNGAYLNFSKAEIIQTGIGITKITSYNTYSLKKSQMSIKILKDSLNSVGLETKIISSGKSAIWEKALINIGINAIGALSRLTNGEIMNYEYLHWIIQEVIEEALNIAKEMKIELSPSLFYLESALSVLESTRKNKNSMFQDILKKSRTEIEFLNGKIVEFGKKYQKDVPVNKTIYLLIKGLEKSYL